MTVGFMGGFAEWLGAVTPFPVTIVSAPTQLEARQDLSRPIGLASDVEWADGIARSKSGGGEIIVRRRTSRFLRWPEAWAPSAIGVLLTGMGEDGATRSLCEMRKAGAFTIAEHPSTAIVYGMPAAAVRMGGACSRSVPAGDIARRRILELVCHQSGRPCNGIATARDAGGVGFSHSGGGARDFGRAARSGRVGSSASAGRGGGAGAN